jgi:hypothetical protein
MAFEFNKKNIILMTMILYKMKILILKYLQNSNLIEIIDEDHPICFLCKRLVHDSIKINIVHGWYNKETKTVKFLVGFHPSKYGDIDSCCMAKILE